MWGTRGSFALVGKQYRFIPTHVGNSESSVAQARTIPVHPHACGELVLLLFGGVTKTGSSPRMWGTLISPYFATVPARFIPTHVGNSQRR